MTSRQHGATRSSWRAWQPRHARHVFKGHSVHWVDVSTSLFPEVVPEIDANPEHKRLNLYTWALLLLRCPPCLNKHGATRTTSTTHSLWCARHVQCVSWASLSVNFPILWIASSVLTQNCSTFLMTGLFLFFYMSTLFTTVMHQHNVILPNDLFHTLVQCQ